NRNKKDVFAFANYLSVRSVASRKVSGRSRASPALREHPSFHLRFLSRHLQNARAAAAFWFQQNWRGKEVRHSNQPSRKPRFTVRRNTEHAARWSDRIPPAVRRTR